MSGNPFDSIESAHEYVRLLITQVDDVKASLAGEVAAAREAGAGRQLDALRLVDYKLDQLGRHLAAGSRILNDLRALRRLLLGERPGAEGATESAASDSTVSTTTRGYS